jgi:hypothetical protein
MRMKIILFISLIFDSISSSLTLYQTMPTTSLPHAKMFAATNRPNIPVTLVLLIFVHSLLMVAAHAQEIK